MSRQPEMNEVMACDSRQEKHLEMHEAIQGLSSVSRGLDELIIRIQGPLSIAGEDPQEKEPHMYLVDVLNKGPDAIRSETEENHKRINQIVDLLF